MEGFMFILFWSNLWLFQLNIQQTIIELTDV